MPSIAASEGRQAIIEQLRSEKEFILCCHVQPDGDGLGSALALGHYLRANGKKVTVTLGEEIAIPPAYQFMPGSDLIVDPPKESDESVFIALDCANFDRLGTCKDIAFSSKILINVDHHPDNSNFGSINLVLPETSSTSEIVYSILKEMGASIDLDIATCLYVGIVTDTGRFQYNNTTASSLRIAAELVDSGVDPNTIFQHVYENNSFAWLKIVGRGIENAVFVPELSYVYTAVKYSDFRETGASMGETENLVDWLRGLQGVNIAAVLKETKDKKIKVSMRSTSDYSVGDISRSFGGGGHKNAAGFVSEEEIEDVTEALQKAVSETLKMMQASK